MVHSVAIIGDGAISRRLRGYLAVDAAFDVVAVLSRQSSGALSPDVYAVLAGAETVVEAAGVDAVAEFGPTVIGDGNNFLISSIGALANPDLRLILSAGPGRYFPTIGAIGGLDLLQAASASGGLKTVSLRTRKLPRALVQGWMSGDEQTELLEATAPIRLFSGSPEQAVSKFPASLNVAFALSLAVGPKVPVEIELLADPAATFTEHRISASGSAGEYQFLIRNDPDPEQPRSSGLTARSFYSGLRRLAQPNGMFI